MIEHRYAGFWIRVAASMIDSLLFILLLAPLLTFIYGSSYWTTVASEPRLWDLLLNYLAPAIAAISFWVYRSATPGKMLLKLKIVDAETGGKPDTAHLIGRYLGYYVSTLPLLLGLVWVAFDQRKQGWHDKLAGTLVIYDPEA